MLAVCCVAAVARAQESAGEPPAEAPSSAEVPPSAEAPPSSAEAPPSAEAQAAERFRRGIQLFDDGDFAPALVEFERAYELSPNYRVLENIGIVNIRLGHYANAARTLRRYLDEGG